MPATLLYSAGTISKNRPPLLNVPNRSIPARSKRVMNWGKENSSSNKRSYAYYLEQVRTLNKMKQQLHEVHGTVCPDLKLKLMKSVKHMESVVNKHERALFRP